MQSYEVILIISPDADQDAVDDSINTVTNFAKKNQGEILKSKNKFYSSRHFLINKNASIAPTTPANIINSVKNVVVIYLFKSL